MSLQSTLIKFLGCYFRTGFQSSVTTYVVLEGTVRDCPEKEVTISAQNSASICECFRFLMVHVSAIYSLHGGSGDIRDTYA